MVLTIIICNDNDDYNVDDNEDDNDDDVDDDDVVVVIRRLSQTQYKTEMNIFYASKERRIPLWTHITNTRILQKPD